MFAAASATMTSFIVVLFCENNITLWTIVKIFRFQIARHVANLPPMAPNAHPIGILPSAPTHELEWSHARKAGVSLSIRRLDEAVDWAPGNKAWKLQWQLEKAQQMPSKALLTFGGPWSNHLHATAMAGKKHGIRTIGVVRGERSEIDLTPTLRDCQEWGMRLVFVSRAEYAEKTSDFFLAWLRDSFGNPWIVPEGGANDIGLMGCQSIIQPDDLARPWDAIVVAAGTGTTAAGMALALRGTSPLYACSALKGLDHAPLVQEQLSRALNDDRWAHEVANAITWWNDAHLGGFAKSSPDLRFFMDRWTRETGVPLDRVYTGKMLFKIHHVLAQASENRPKGWQHGCRVLVIHTGGLQGNRSMDSKTSFMNVPS